MVEQGRQGASEKKGPAGLQGLAMNEVPSSATQEASELPRRAGWRWLLLLAILVLVGLLGYGARMMINVAPGEAAQQELEGKLKQMALWRMGEVLGARYVAGDRIRVDFAAEMGLNAPSLRSATIAVMKVLMIERPNRDLYIDGYQGERQIVQAEYHQKGKLQVAGGGFEPDITVRVEGEPEGGIGQLVKPSASEHQTK